MMTATDLTVRSFHFAWWFAEQFCSDLTPAEWLHRPCGGSNCAAWTVGHLVLSERSMLTKLGGTPKGALPEGFEARFSQKEDAPQAEDFGDTSILLPLLKTATDELIAHLETLSQEYLSQPLPRLHPLFKTHGDTAALGPVHLVMHLGQISTIRRSLGRKPVF